MSDSVRPQRRQPTRLPCPWDSPSKNTGVGCHFLLQCMKMKSESEVAQSCLTLHNPMDCSLPGSSVHGIFQARVLEWVARLTDIKSIYPTINTFKVSSSVFCFLFFFFFSKLTYVQPPQVNFRIFSSPQKEILCPSAVTLIYFWMFR